MGSVEARLRAKLDELSKDLDRCVREAEEARRRGDEIQKMRLVLEELLLSDETQDRAIPDVAAVPAQVQNSTDDGLRPVDGIIGLLREHPGGLHGRDIVNRLVGRIKTESAKPQNIIRNSLLNLHKQGRIIRDEATGLYRLNS